MPRRESREDPEVGMHLVWPEGSDPEVWGAGGQEWGAEGAEHPGP